MKFKWLYLMDIIINVEIFVCKSKKKAFNVFTISLRV